MQRRTYDVVVVGAGIVGCATAYHLARAGQRVALLDRSGVAAEASDAGAGMLTPLAEAGASDLNDPLLRLGLAGLRHYEALEAQLESEAGLWAGLVHLPTLYPAFDDGQAEALRRDLAALQTLRPELRWLEADEVRQREPLLSPSVRGAVFSPAEGNVAIGHLTRLLARASVLNGAELLAPRSALSLLWDGARVRGVLTEVEPIEAAHVVLATGAWSSAWHAQGECAAIVYPLKGQLLALRTSGQPLRHTIYAGPLGYLVPKADGSVFVGATSERRGFDKTPTAGGLAHLLTVVHRVAPALEEAAVDRTWAGLRPVSADGLPFIGPAPSSPGLWLAVGHGRIGAITGPVTGFIIAELIQGRPVPYDLDLRPFAPERLGPWRRRLTALNAAEAAQRQPELFSQAPTQAEAAAEDQRRERS
ncbi:glycine oxidase ThiO [Thermogemmatispora tikiterensis]|uniref:glycine oxidase n=1 Tax=Thermogemmatispora tikiterensis TaxID=1825093 RepID=A0A328VT48_9CHLR|nr:glycine oxidase ThiO [Thermogemmatispora tikiterensis]RAQ98464.1 glycine oxidase ThiO [Thermogemmatispora tikiterensis]